MIGNVIINFENNPTLRESYVVNLVDVIVFFLISLIVRNIIDKKLLNKKINKDDVNISGKTMLTILIVASIILLNKKVYAIMASTTYNLDIITIMINFVGIYVVNFVIELITNYKNINKSKFLEIFSETVMENIIFNTVLIICIMTTNVFLSSFRVINIIVTVVITSLYKVIKLLLSEHSVSKKALIAVLYFLILFAFGVFTNCTLRESYNSKNGIFLKREVEGYKDGKIESNISIYYKWWFVVNTRADFELFYKVGHTILIYERVDKYESKKYN